MKQYGFWLYSTMVQATAALFGVLGMFIIFKLQLLKERIKNAEKMTIDVLRRYIRLGYPALERIPFVEVKKILDKEIRDRKEELSLPEEKEYHDGSKKKTEEILEILEAEKRSLENANNHYNILLKDGKETIKWLGLIFVVSIAFLIFNPMFERVGLILLTIFYTILCMISFKKVWYLMKEAFTF